MIGLGLVEIVCYTISTFVGFHQFMILLKSLASAKKNIFLLKFLPFIFLLKSITSIPCPFTSFCLSHRLVIFFFCPNGHRK